MTLQAGLTLGPYRITGSLGIGGMGEVYRARDMRLDRDVAIKALPVEFGADSERLGRFDREAKVLASLNHPNIAAIYGIEESEGAKYLVLEYIAGESLDEVLHGPEHAGTPVSAAGANNDRSRPPAAQERGHAARGVGDERTPRGRLSLDESLEVARGLCHALEAAHERGIVHRDVKPANIMITASGEVKVLDFGLASQVDAATQHNHADSKTTMGFGTQVGMIFGTPAYMSPEQAKGRATDKRTDIWAFGCVLYEMLAGNRAFDREDAAETIAAIVSGSPDWAALPHGVPARIVELLKACLQRDVRERVPDIAVVRLVLDGKASLGSGAADRPRASSLRRWPVALGAIVLAAIAAATGWAFKPFGGTSLPVARFAYSLPQAQGFTRPGRHVIAISPAGTRIVYVANQQLYLRELDELDPAPVRGTQEDPMEPVFSPDGNWIAYFAQTGVGTDVWQLKKVAAAGGTPITLNTIGAAPFGASWQDHDILYGAGGDHAGIFAISDVGGEPRLLIEGRTDQRLAHPQLLADGKHVVFSSGIGPAAEGNIEIATTQGAGRKTLVTGGTDPRVLDNGLLVYVHDDQLFAAPFDARRAQLTGPAIPVEENVLEEQGTATAQFAIASTGTLVFLPGTNAEQRQLVWVDRAGNENPLSAPPRAYQYPRISPEGTKIAVNINNDLWLLDARTETLNRLTFTPEAEVEPVWTADGKSVIFSSRVGPLGSGADLIRAAIDGSGTIERLSENHSGGLPQALSRDGHLLMIRRSGRGAVLEAALLGSHGPESQASFATEGYNYFSAALSPDGKFVAFVASKTAGSAEVYVRRFPEMAGQQWQVSVGGATAPVWGANGRELFYAKSGAASTDVVRVPVDTTSGFSTGAAERLFSVMASYAGLGPRSFDISPDGSRFIVVKPVTADLAKRSSFVVVTSWSAAVAARLSTQGR